MKTDTYQCMCNVFQKSLLEFLFNCLIKFTTHFFLPLYLLFHTFLLGITRKADAHKVQKGYIYHIFFSSQFNLEMSNELQKEIQDFLALMPTRSGTEGRIPAIPLKIHTSHGSEGTDWSWLHLHLKTQQALLPTLLVSKSSNNITWISTIYVLQKVCQRKLV